MGNSEILILCLFHIETVCAVNMGYYRRLVQLEIGTYYRHFAYRLCAPAVFNGDIERLNIAVEITCAVGYQTYNLHFAHIRLNHGQNYIQQRIQLYGTAVLYLLYKRENHYSLALRAVEITVYFAAARV